MFKVGDKVRVIKGEMWAIGNWEGVVTSVDESNFYPIRVDFVTWTHNFKAEELALADDVAPPSPVEEAKPEPTEKERLREFFFGKPEPVPDWAASWKAEGKCPKCGEEGRIHLSTFVCSTHGPY